VKSAILYPGYFAWAAVKLMADVLLADPHAARSETMAMVMAVVKR